MPLTLSPQIYQTVLLQGPVVFHLPQEVVNTIKREAHRNVVLQQMLLDMFRSDKPY